MITVNSNISIQRHHWQPLSVHLWTYCTHPTHDVNDVWRLATLLFLNSGVVSFTSHNNQLSVSAVRQDLRFSSLSEKTRKFNGLWMSLQRQHFLVSYFESLSVGPCQPGFEPGTSWSADQWSLNWVNEVAVN